MASDGCAECAALREELAEARRERDALMLDLARAREVANAAQLRTGSEALGELTLSGVADAPLRYVLVDRVNDGLKQLLGKAHPPIKRVAAAAARLAGKR